VDYINKPFALVEVLARVESQLNIRQLQSQLQQKAKSLEIENEFLQNRVCDRLGFDHELYKDLRVAQAQNQLQLYYQPIINFDTGEILSFEALLRWIHPVHGIISPTDFIPLAESTGLIIPIGFWVIEQAIAQLSNWNQLFPEYANLSITVNVSGYQLQDDSLFRHTQNALQASNVDPQKLKLEITESVLMTDPDTAIKVLNRFKQLGVQLYIDDFGTGYSTLSRLYDFPVDVLKIDRSFVNDGQWTMIEAITNLAKTLGKDIIIEGIETIEQLTILKNIGCHKGQGYYFSKPLDAVKTTNTLKRTLAIKTPEIFGVLV
jgi:EAL domain-containing protein (putative c-di-GMP-specific phosphodiesterase class I)